MGDVRAESGAQSSASSDASKLVASVPVVGKFLAAFFEVSSKAKAIVLTILFLLIVYPILSLAAALLIISKSPPSVRTGARNAILTSIGVNDRMIRNLEDTEDKKFDRLNQIIDASIPFTFSSDGQQPQYTEKVAADQKITFDALIQPQSFNKTSPECMTVQRPNNDYFGRLTVTSYESGGQYHAPIRLMFDRSINVGKFSTSQWKDFQDKSYSGHPEQEQHLQVKVDLDHDLASNAYLKCNRIVATIYMNMFKLPIDRAAE